MTFISLIEKDREFARSRVKKIFVDALHERIHEYSVTLVAATSMGVFDEQIIDALRKRRDTAPINSFEMRTDRAEAFLFARAILVNDVSADMLARFSPDFNTIVPHKRTPRELALNSAAYIQFRLSTEQVRDGIVSEFFGVMF